jgi:hypothetical protein
MKERMACRAAANGRFPQPVVPAKAEMQGRSFHSNGKPFPVRRVRPLGPRLRGDEEGGFLVPGSWPELPLARESDLGIAR